MNSVGKFWLGRSIRMKILSYFFAVIILVSLFNVYLNNNNNKIMDQFNDTMINNYSINHLLELTTTNKEALNNYLRELNSDDKLLYLQSKKEMSQLISDLFLRLESLETYFILTAILNSSESYTEIWDKAIIERENSIETYYVNLYKGGDIEAYTEEYIQDLLHQSLAEGTELYNQLVKKEELMRSISMILIFAVTLIAMFIGVVSSNVIVKPIKKLATASLKISSGELNVDIIQKEAEDEIGVLTDSFNIMSKNITKYVTDLEQKVVIEKKLHIEELEVIRMEQLVKEAKFEALQSQINPHFLFNTLNTISRTAMFEEADTTMRLIQSLSNLFRYKLRSDSNLIRLDEEIQIIQEYIYLQKMRFKERLVFEIEYDELSKNVMIPIFSLQPIVENAIIHGIEPKVEGGKVSIKIHSHKDKKDLVTTILISDSGIGMSDERLDEVRSFELLNKNSIGIGNVYHRFMLTYGEQTNIWISSCQGEGTCVEFSFRKDSFYEE